MSSPSTTKRIQTLAALLGLKDWDITLSTSLSGDDDYGTVAVTDGRRRASIRLCEEFDSLTLREQEVTLIHELLHCHTAPVLAYLRATLPQAVGAPAADAIYNAVDQHLEHAVDAVAVAVQEAGIC